MPRSALRSHTPPSSHCPLLVMCLYQQAHNLSIWAACSLVCGLVNWATVELQTIFGCIRVASFLPQSSILNRLSSIRTLSSELVRAASLLHWRSRKIRAYQIKLNLDHNNQVLQGCDAGLEGCHGKWLIITLIPDLIRSTSASLAYHSWHDKRLTKLHIKETLSHFGYCMVYLV